jgi:hypothetical protein
MKDALTRAVIGCITILAATLVLVLGIRGYEVLVPAQVEHDSANITQADYAQAHAKWDAQKINVYEINVDDGDGRLQFRMRVDRQTGNLYLLSLRAQGVDESVDGLNTPLSGVQIKVFGAYSVDSVFASINKAISAAQTSSPTIDATGSSLFTDVDVQFDPNKGYPTRFTTYSRTTPTSHEVTWRTQQSDMQFSNLTVIN